MNMKERLGIASLILAVFVWIPTLPAADLAWEYIYEGDILPDDTSLGDDAWQLLGDNQFAEVTDEGELHIGDIGQNHCFFLYNLEDAALMAEATIEARVKVLSQSGANFEVLVGMQDGSNSKWLDLFPDHILLNSTSSTYDVDMTEYHILRMVRNADEIRIYVDDELVISEAHVGAGESWIGFIFGAGATTSTSEQYWDYLAFTTEGGFSPEDLPSYASMQRQAELAGDPSPATDANDVPRDVSLSWTPGMFAVTHDVYLGTSLEDVNTAAPGTLVSQGQAGTDYAPESVFEFGQTYYWRVDEVNGAPDNTIFAGDIWNFTVEPLAYAIENVVATSNGSSDGGAGPENTVDGSGLNANDEHSVAAGDMWLATPGDDPLWIQYEFDRAYKLHEALIWNYNVQFELVLGFGLKDVTVEYSTDGVDWTALGDVVFAQATATNSYTANTAVDLGGIAAKFVRLIAHSSYGVMGQFGLSEVRFTFIPVQARKPQPADAETAVAVDAGLAWRAGREAAAHDVYLGTAPDALALTDTVTVSDYTPADLEFGTTYYWRIDEANAAEAVSVWEGNLWSFGTLEYVVIDDMESYDDEENVIYETWIDGWVNETGSTVGYLEGPFAERSIVNSGRQSMPLEYANDGAPFYSEAEYDLGTLDLTANGADTLRLFVAGQVDNTPAPLYVAIEDTNGAVAVVPQPDTAIVTSSDWTEWLIPYSELNGIDLGRVATLYIGVGDRDNPSAGGTGLVFIDDIGFGHPAAIE
jgi:F5/8 type C domain-containing protein